MPLLRHMPIAALESAWTDRGNDIPRFRGQGLGAKALSNPLHNAPKLGFPGRQGDVFLGGRPVLEGVRAEEGDAARGRPSGLRAPGEVRVDIDVQLGLFLPGVLQD